jgi:ABC-type phosphate/phosphonate transport system ATPase subunit
MKTPIIPLNPGLVAIIGARGSGKAALADMIAAGCDSISDEAWNAEVWARAVSELKDSGGIPLAGEL